MVVKARLAELEAEIARLTQERNEERSDAKWRAGEMARYERLLQDAHHELYCGVGAMVAGGVGVRGRREGGRDADQAVD